MARIDHPHTQTERDYNDAVQRTEEFIRRGDTSSPEFLQADALPRPRSRQTVFCVAVGNRASIWPT